MSKLSIKNNWREDIPLPWTIIEHADARKMAQDALSNFFGQFDEYNLDQAKEITEGVFASIAEQPQRQGPALEFRLKRYFKSVGFSGSFPGSFEGRAKLIYSQIKNFVEGESVLDLGCGDGLVAKEIKNNGGKGIQCTLSDVLDYRHESVNDFEFKLMKDGEVLPFDDNVFDTVLLLTVIHHADEPEFLLKEAFRLAKSRVIVIESVFGVTSLDEHPFLDGVVRQATDFEKRFVELKPVNQLAYVAFIDWFYNRVFHDDVQVTFNYLRPKDWIEKLFALGAKDVNTNFLGIDQPIVPEFHTLHVADLKNEKS